MATITTRSGKGSPLTNNEVDANFTNLNTDKAELSGAAFTGAITTNSTIDGRDVATDGTKLDGIEASADVTDTTNVTAAGALMDSELTAIASVKALNQGVATTDSPTFAGLTTSADISFGDSDKAIFGAGSDLQIYHDGSNSYITDTGTGNLYVRASNELALTSAAGEAFFLGIADGSSYLYHNGGVKLNTTSTGIDVTGTATMDGLTVDGAVSSGDITIAVDDTPTLSFKKASSADVLASINVTTDAGSGGKLVIQTKRNGNTPVDRLTIDDDGNVGINQSSPSSYYAKNLVVGAANEEGITLAATATSATNYLLFADGTSGDAQYRGQIAYSHSSDNLDLVSTGTMSFKSGSSRTERMRIDSSGRLNVGQTNAYAPAGGGVSIGTFEESSNSRTNLVVSNQNSGNAAGASVVLASHGADYIIEHQGSGKGSALTFTRANTEHMRIDSSGTLTTPSGVDFNIMSASGMTLGSTSSITVFKTNNQEAARIDASQNLLVGKTSTSVAVAGCRLGSFGAILTRGDGSEPLRVNRTGSNGDIIKLDKDGTNVGSIGVEGGDALYIQSGTTSGSGLHFHPTSGTIRPVRNGSTIDNAIDLGTANRRFTDLYLSGKANTGSITTDNANTQFNKISRTGATALYVQQGDNTNDILQLRAGNGQAGTGTQHVTVTGSGNLLVGTTSASHSGISSKCILKSSDNVLGIVTDAGSKQAVRFTNGTTAVGSINVTASATTYNTSSDQRLKDNIVDAPSASDDIDAIQVRSFDWKADGSHQKYGMVAQELNTVAPEAVSAPEDPEEMMGVDYSKLVPMLVKEIQSLRNRVAQLEE